VEKDFSVTNCSERDGEVGFTTNMEKGMGREEREREREEGRKYGMGGL